MHFAFEAWPGNIKKRVDFYLKPVCERATPINLQTISTMSTPQSTAVSQKSLWITMTVLQATMPMQILHCFICRRRQWTCKLYLQQCHCKCCNVSNTDDAKELVNHFYNNANANTTRQCLMLLLCISIIFATACNLNVQNWVLVISNDPKESLPWFSFHAIVCSDRSSLSHLTMIITGLGL